MTQTTILPFREMFIENVAAHVGINPAELSGTVKIPKHLLRRLEKLKPNFGISEGDARDMVAFDALLKMNGNPDEIDQIHYAAKVIGRNTGKLLETCQSLNKIRGQIWYNVCALQKLADSAREGNLEESLQKSVLLHNEANKLLTIGKRNAADLRRSYGLAVPFEPRLDHSEKLGLAYGLVKFGFTHESASVGVLGRRIDRAACLFDADRVGAELFWRLNSREYNGIVESFANVRGRIALSSTPVPFIIPESPPKSFSEAEGEVFRYLVENRFSANGEVKTDPKSKYTQSGFARPVVLPQNGDHTEQFARMLNLGKNVDSYYRVSYFCDDAMAAGLSDRQLGDLFDTISSGWNRFYNSAVRSGKGDLAVRTFFDDIHLGWTRKGLVPSQREVRETYRKVGKEFGVSQI